MTTAERDLPFQCPKALMNSNSSFRSPHFLSPFLWMNSSLLPHKKPLYKKVNEILHTCSTHQMLSKTSSTIFRTVSSSTSLSGSTASMSLTQINGGGCRGISVKHNKTEDLALSGSQLQIETSPCFKTRIQARNNRRQ